MRHFLVLLLLIVPSAINAAVDSTQTFVLENQRIRCTVVVTGGRLVADRLEGRQGWLSAQRQTRPLAVETDAGFAVELMWSDWRAPGKQNNADNPAVLTSADFRLTKAEERTSGDARLLVLTFASAESPLEASATYRLDSASTTLRRKLALRDTTAAGHLLRTVWGRRGAVKEVVSVINPGQFGQPVALALKNGGVFFGLEYPASQNHFSGSEGLSCGQEMGMRVGKGWIESDWVVEGLVPDADVKKAFFAYLDEVRVAPLRPYTLYNTWYDLRSPEYPHVPPENVMSEASAMKMADLLRTNMIEKYGIALDAFVLDDGWDVYDSDWVLRKEQWPHGLKPLASTLARTGTSLGMWFGPTGGYSLRKRRLSWMSSHGYETVDNQLCVAGANYSALLQRRVHDYTANEDVRYFKWDGIQFSCNQPGHGHPIDIYSRRAVLESVARMVDTVRHAHRDMFLNITSGTWLSPWWLKYANTIWMDGQDYGYADVPSISKRDAAITYRDFVLYEDFHLKGLWFPVANLMTHGIIKGKLELLGSASEPLDKFTDDALLYCARGVSMYELYISPDIMSPGEWRAIAQSLAWARDRFPTLMQTEMVGGNPLQRESYGYVHFKGSRGIIAVRNPVITPATVAVQLASSQGLDPTAKSLVLERVYPNRWIAPRLYKSGQTVKLPLDGFETAIYELYPLSEATEPLIAGASFDVLRSSADAWTIRLHSAEKGACLLNPAAVKELEIHGRKVAPSAFVPLYTTGQSIASGTLPVRLAAGVCKTAVTVAQGTREGMLAILCVPDTATEARAAPLVSVAVDSVQLNAPSEQEEGRSRWFTVPLAEGKHDIIVSVLSREKPWKGKVSLWFIGRTRPPAQEFVVALVHPAAVRIMPPQAWEPGQVRKQVKLGAIDLQTSTATE